MFVTDFKRNVAGCDMAFPGTYAADSNIFFNYRPMRCQIFSGVSACLQARVKRQRRLWRKLISKKLRSASHLNHSAKIYLLLSVHAHHDTFTIDCLDLVLHQQKGEGSIIQEPSHLKTSPLIAQSLGHNCLSRATSGPSFKIAAYDSLLNAATAAWLTLSTVERHTIIETHSANRDIG